MRVLHVAQPDEGGVPRVLRGYAEDQVAAGWDVHLACSGAGSWAREVPGAVHHRWVAGRDPGRSLIPELRALSELVELVRPDLLHLHSAKAGLVGRLAVRGAIPTVVQPHAWSFEAATGPVRAGALGWERLGGRWADRILCVSRAERDRGRRAGIRGSYAVVPNGVPTTWWAPRDQAQARRHLGLGSEPLALCLGRVTRQKGQDLLLDAWAAGRPEGARLAIVGDGDRRAEWSTEWSAALDPAAVDTVLWPGAVDDPRDWIAAADVVVVPSRWEGMALVPLEALAMARSVVAFDVTGVAESLGPGCGAVVPARDVAELGVQLARRLADPESTRAEGLRGREWVLAHYDQGRAAEAVRGLYEEILVERKTRQRMRESVN